MHSRCFFFIFPHSASRTSSILAGEAAARPFLPQSCESACSNAKKKSRRKSLFHTLANAADVVEIQSQSFGPKLQFCNSSRQLFYFFIRTYVQSIRRKDLSEQPISTYSTYFNVSFSRLSIQTGQKLLLPAISPFALSLPHYPFFMA